MKQPKGERNNNVQGPPNKLPGPIGPGLSVPKTGKNSGAAPAIHTVPEALSRPCRSGTSSVTAQLGTQYRTEFSIKINRQSDQLRQRSLITSESYSRKCVLVCETDRCTVHEHHQARQKPQVADTCRSRSNSEDPSHLLARCNSTTDRV